MSLLSRLFAREPDPREPWRPLWHTLVGTAREVHWFADRGAADTLDGRFDMISMLTALFMLRLESEPNPDAHGISAAARLTELFVEDMEGQMREAGIGDPTVGKMMGRMMATLGGRARCATRWHNRTTRHWLLWWYATCTCLTKSMARHAWPPGCARCTDSSPGPISQRLSKARSRHDRRDTP